MGDLASRDCIPCRGGVPPVSEQEAAALLEKLHGWDVIKQHHLAKSYVFKDFMDGVRFVNRVATLAESVGHHPDLHLSFGKVRVEVWTHKIDGLTESDFILAAKIDRLLP
jgi:4a-hydroxytetrahydrobiopterin dehydratase